MNDTANDRRERILELGLAEFDRARARRRVAHRAGIAATALAIAVASYLLLPANRPAAAPSLASATRALPAYVQVITDDAQLNSQLELANACERVGRREGRVYVVECTAGHEPGLDAFAPQR